MPWPSRNRRCELRTALLRARRPGAHYGATRPSARAAISAWKRKSKVATSQTKAASVAAPAAARVRPSDAAFRERPADRTPNAGHHLAVPSVNGSARARHGAARPALEAIVTPFTPGAGRLYWADDRPAPSTGPANLDDIRCSRGGQRSRALDDRTACRSSAGPRDRRGPAIATGHADHGRRARSAVAAQGASSARPSCQIDPASRSSTFRRRLRNPGFISSTLKAAGRRAYLSPMAAGPIRTTPAMPNASRTHLARMRRARAHS